MTDPTGAYPYQPVGSPGGEPSVSEPAPMIATTAHVSALRAELKAEIEKLHEALHAHTHETEEAPEEAPAKKK